MILVLIASASLQPATATAAVVRSDRHGLRWQQFAASPTRAQINECRLVDGLDVLTLYYGLSGGQYPAAEFAHYFPEYRGARDEFERRRVEPQVIEKLRTRRRELEQASLCAKITDIPVGDYDFETKRFPLIQPGTHFLGAKHDAPGIKTFAVLEDHSRSAERVLSQANSMAKLRAKSYRWTRISSLVDFINGKDELLFPMFLPVNERNAQKAATEFGTLVDQDVKAMAQGLGREYKPDRTIIAYVLFRPESASTQAGTMGDLDFTGKVVQAQALAVVLATDKGTVLGVFRPTKKEVPEQPAPTVAEKPAATPPAKKNASDMSLDELNQYLKRDGGGQ